MGLGCFQWYPMSDSTNAKKIKTQEIPFEFWGKRVYCEGDRALKYGAKRSWSLLVQRYSKPTWI